MSRYLLAALLVAAAGSSVAAPPPGADPALSEWYSSLRSPITHGSCCGLADCRHPDEVRISGGDRSVRFGGRWYDVPPAAVLAMVNPTGAPVACLYSGAVICFIPIAET